MGRVAVCARRRCSTQRCLCASSWRNSRYRIISERRETTPWHPHHITERYGLFTLIVLGESLLASANAIIEARANEETVASLAPLAVLTLVVTAGLWWVYFWPPHHESIGGLQESIRYGYGHYVVFAAAGALSAGIEVEIDALTGHSDLSDVAASFCVTVPVALFLASVWWIAMRPLCQSPRQYGDADRGAAGARGSR